MTTKAKPGAAQALAEARLRAVAVRITVARVKVLAALLEARSAVSHQDIRDSLAGMDRVTLYRALDCLTDAGLAHKIAGDDRVFRYSAGTEHGPARQAPLGHQHGHFKCTRCARVFCLEREADGPDTAPAPAPSGRAALPRQLQDVLQEALGQGFQGHDIELTIKGWCADCSH
jgi:Fur family ferric uptake transcriptional regulator